MKDKDGRLRNMSAKCLLHRNRIYQKVLSSSKLSIILHFLAFQSAFRARGPLAMLEHFDTVYSILQ